MLLMTLEDLGFCKKGEAGPFVENGRIRLGGELPVNTDGGGLSALHPGQRGLFCGSRRPGSAWRRSWRSTRKAGSRSIA